MAAGAGAAVVAGAAALVVVGAACPAWPPTIEARAGKKTHFFHPMFSSSRIELFPLLYTNTTLLCYVLQTSSKGKKKKEERKAKAKASKKKGRTNCWKKKKEAEMKKFSSSSFCPRWMN